MTLKIKEIYAALDQLAPFRTAASWDNVGVLLGDPEDVVTKALLALDITPEVIEEAEENGANLIITHHPVIFSPLTSISSQDLIYTLIQKNIHVISAHTNLDLATGGVNTALAKALKLVKLKPLQNYYEENQRKIIVFVPEEALETVYQAMTAAGAGSQGNYQGAGFVQEGTGRFLPLEGATPTIGQVGRLEKVKEAKLEMLVTQEKLADVVAAMKQAHPYEEPGYDIFENFGISESWSLGVVGELTAPMTGREFAEHVKQQLKAPNVRYTHPEKNIRRVAVCSGSGGDLLSDVLSQGADAFVTGEVKHHQILEANRQGLTLVDAGHFATETVFMDPLKTYLSETLPTLSVGSSTAMTDGMFGL